MYDRIDRSRKTSLWVLYLKAILGGLVFCGAYLFAMVWIYGLSFVGAVAAYFLMPFIPFMVALSAEFIPRIAVCVIVLIMLVILQKRCR